MFELVLKHYKLTENIVVLHLDLYFFVRLLCFLHPYCTCRWPLPSVVCRLHLYHQHVINSSILWTPSQGYAEEGPFPAFTGQMAVKTPWLPRLHGTTYLSQSPLLAIWSCDPPYPHVGGNTCEHRKNVNSTQKVTVRLETHDPLDVRQLTTDPPRHPSISHYLINFETF